MSQAAEFVFFEIGKPLPQGMAEEELATWDLEMGAARIAGVFPLVGVEKALSIAKRLGAYELGPELVRRLELEGVALGRAGEVPSLSPLSWPKALECEPYPDLRTRVENGGGEVRGLRLNEADRERFQRFLARQGVSLGGDPWQVVDVARHYFFQHSLKVVVAYTGPRFHRS